MYLLDLESHSLVECEIVPGNLRNMPLKKEGWNFNWRKIVTQVDSDTFVLRLKSDPKQIQGVLNLKIIDGMLIMDLLEIAPHNIGSRNKRFDYVAGCLIAFACKESFNLDSNYKGFLTFESKTNLVSWYTEKYHAKIAIRQKMYIEPKDGIKLIEQYHNRK